MPHPSEHTSVDAPLNAEESERIAEAMSAFTTPSRLRLLFALTAGERSVEELAGLAGVSGPVASQQLRVLRQIGAVAVRREGRNAFYRLRDHHMAALLEAVRNHSEHAAEPGGAHAVAEPAGEHA